MCVEKVLGHSVTLAEFSTHVGLANAASDAIPLEGASNPSTKEPRKVVHMILQVSSVSFNVAMTSKRDHVNKAHQTD